MQNYTPYPLQMIAQFKKFAQGMNPAKAEEIVKQKLQSGEMSKEQFESLKKQAQDFMAFLK